MDNYDVIVIGAGPAGISCAIYLKRYNFNPLVISTNSSSLLNASIENYYGIEKISGSDLINNGINQAKRLGIDVVDAEVTSIDPFGGIKVKSTKGEYSASALFLGLGKSRNKLNIINGDLFLGKGISFCATCDGFFFKNKNIGILGAGAYMEEELEVLSRFTPNITIFTNGEEYISDKYQVVSDKVLEAFGSDKLHGIKTSNNTYNLDGLFVALGSADASDFSKHLGIKTNDLGFIVVDKDFMTNISGIFAGGDVIGGMMQVVKAASDGAQAALAIKKYINTKKASV